MATFLRRVLTCHWTVSLFMMGLFGAVFSLALLNLITLLNANLRLIARHGEHVLFEGALQQLGELTLLGYGAVISYVLFKVCECALVQRIMREPEKMAESVVAALAESRTEPHGAAITPSPAAFTGDMDAVSPYRTQPGNGL